MVYFYFYFYCLFYDLFIIIGLYNNYLCPNIVVESVAVIFYLVDHLLILLDWISHSGFVVVDVINCLLLGRGFRSDLQTKFCRIFGRLSGEIILGISCQIGWGRDFCFSN